MTRDTAACTATPSGASAPQDWSCIKPAGHPHLHETDGGGCWGDATFAAEPSRTGQLRTFTCADCGSVGTQPTHHPTCHRLPVARLWADPVAARARNALAAWRTANETLAKTPLDGPEDVYWATRDREVAARNALIPALAGLLFQLDARAGIQ